MTWKHFRLDDAQLQALSAHYPGLRFLRADGDERDDNGEVRIWINVSGTAEALRRAGFIARKWTELPPCGVRYCRTNGFGSARVHRTKRGLRLECAQYDDALDKIAPALVMPLLEPFKRAAFNDRVINVLRLAEKELLRQQGRLADGSQQDDGGVRA